MEEITEVSSYTPPFWVAALCFVAAAVFGAYTSDVGGMGIHVLLGTGVGYALPIPLVLIVFGMVSSSTRTARYRRFCFIYGSALTLFVGAVLN